MAQTTREAPEIIHQPQSAEVRVSAPEPGNKAAAAAPQAVYEVREAKSGVVLDAYMVGTFGAHVRGDERKVRRRAAAQWA